MANVDMLAQLTALLSLLGAMLPVPTHLSVVLGCGWSHCACKIYLSEERVLICNTLTSGHGKCLASTVLCKTIYKSRE